MVELMKSRFHGNHDNHSTTIAISCKNVVKDQRDKIPQVITRFYLSPHSPPTFEVVLTRFGSLTSPYVPLGHQSGSALWLQLSYHSTRTHTKIDKKHFLFFRQIIDNVHVFRLFSFFILAYICFESNC